jgi:hypothetical protein
LTDPVTKVGLLKLFREPYNIIYNINSTDATLGVYGIYETDFGGTNAYVYNNTIYDISNSNGASTGNVYGIYVKDSADRIVKNNIAGGFSTAGSGTTQDYYPSSPANADMDYNMSEDTSASGGNSKTGHDPADLFKNPGSDFHLTVDAAAVDEGDDSMSGTFTSDIDGETRSGSWDMGADEYVSNTTAKSSLIGWSNAGSANMQYSAWDGNDWPDGQDGPSFATLVDWIVVESSPTGKLMLGSTWGGTLYASFFNGSAWGTVKNMGTVNTTTRSFDAAVEIQSGRIVVVAGSGTDLNYWIYDDGSWTVDGSTITGLNLGSSNKNFIELSSNPLTNEIALVFADAASDAYGVIWDATTSSWGNEQLLETDLATANYQAIGVEYIQSDIGAGKAMYVWCTGSNMESRIWNGSSWESELSAVGIGGPGYWVRLRADPTSNRLVFAAVRNLSTLQLVTWSGSAWSAVAWTETLLGQAYRPMDVIFERASNHQGDILVVYSDAANLRYKHGDWDGSTYSWGGETDVDAAYDGIWVQLEYAQSNDIFLAIRDNSSSKLGTWSWDNSAFNFEKDLSSSLQNSSQSHMPFMISPLVRHSVFDYAYYKPITIDPDKIPASCTADLIDYPLLIEIKNDPDLATTNYGGHVESADGYDIIFTTASGSIQLDHEIEQYDGTTGTLAAWVRIPTLSFDEATSIRMRFGNSDVIFSQENITGVWAAHYQGVWHLKEDPDDAGADGIRDATRNFYHATDGPDMDSDDQVEGQIGGSLEFDGTDDEIITTQNFSPPADGTVSFWLKVPDTLNTLGRLFGLGDGFEIRHYNTGIMNFDLNRTGTNDTFVTNSSISTSGQWYHIAAIFSSTDGTYDVYVDGSSDKSGLFTLTPQAAAQLTMGDSTGRTDNWKGTLDELRISNEQSVCRVQTDYNSQKWNNKAEFASEGFITVGEELSGSLIQTHYRWRHNDGSESGGGEIAIYKELTAGENYNSGTETDIDWSTNVRQDQAAFSHTEGDATITLKTAGHYLVMWSMAGDQTGTTGSNRAMLEGLLNLNNDTAFAYGRGWGYLRDSSTSQESYAQGAAIIDTTALGADVPLKLQVFRQDTNLGQFWVRRADLSGMSLLKLNDNWAYARYRETENVQSIAVDEAAKITLDLDTSDEQDTGFSCSNGTVTLTNGGHYLVTYNIGIDTTAGHRQCYVAAVFLDDVEVPGSRTTAYIRRTNGVMEGGLSYIGIINTADGDQFEIKVWGDTNEGSPAATVGGDTTAVTLVKLPDDAYYVRLHESGGGQDLDTSQSNITFDSDDEVDGYFDRSGAEEEIKVKAAGDYLFTWSVFARKPSEADTREQLWTKLTKNGAVQPWALAGNFIRGDDANPNCPAGGASAGAIVEAATDDIFRLVQQNEASNDIAAMQPDRYAIQGVRISSLFWASDEDLSLGGIEKGINKRLRFQVWNNSTRSSGSVQFQLQVAESSNCSSADYTPVPTDTSGDWQIVDSSYITSDGDPTSNVSLGLNDAGSSFVSGELKDAGNTTGGITLGADEFTEIEFSLKATDNATDVGFYCFKLVKSYPGSPSSPLLDGILSIGGGLDGYQSVPQGGVMPVTAINLIAFNAKGDGNEIRVDWETAHEIANLGFNLYRAENRHGPYIQLNHSLIPGLNFSVKGKSYRYLDNDVSAGKLYYYRLEDIDAHGTRTQHGPICVDWDSDGLPDDWEITHGLNPWVNDADADYDNDGLSNLEEYELGLDPFNPDTDGDGIFDGQEDRKSDRRHQTGRQTMGRGLEVISSDPSGITLELHTGSFAAKTVYEGDQEYERLNISEYVHGYTEDVGKPQLPVKGILLDLPEGTSAELSIIETDLEIRYGYQIYPVPEDIVEERSNGSAISEQFVIDETAYNTDRFYPVDVAGLGEVFNYRGQRKQQILLYPLSFNPVSGQLHHYRRIRIRLNFAASGHLPASNLATDLGSTAMWQPQCVSGCRAYKIRIEEEGIYRLTLEVFSGNNLDAAEINLDAIKLYHLGEEVAIEVQDGDVPGEFDADDYIMFYGQPVAAPFTKYARYNVYWLVTSEGSESHKSMAQIDGSPSTAHLAATFEQTVHYELDEYHLALAPGPDELDRWYFDEYVLGAEFTGPDDSPVPVDFTLALPGVAGQGVLSISVWGYFDSDHDVEVWVNDVYQGAFYWSGLAFEEINIEGVELYDGDNTVTLICNSGLDGIIVDWLKVVYPSTFTADGDSLKFSHPDGYRYRIDNLRTPALKVFDVSQPTEVARIVNFETQLSEPPTLPETYTLEFEPATTISGIGSYLVVPTDTDIGPYSIVKDRPTQLSDPDNGADYILITHRNLGWDENGDPSNWLNQIEALRQDQGLRVKIVDVEDIYDEFSFGLQTPQAIKDFLAYAYGNWSSPAPQYVLLVGDTTLDYKDNYGLGTINYVPSFTVFNNYMGETVSDEWFVKIAGDDALPDLYIGRLPADSIAEAEVMVEKILVYEASRKDKTWQANVMLVADNIENKNRWEEIFENINEDAAEQLPAGMNEPFRGYLRDYLLTEDLTADIAAEINAGALIVNFSGHGALQRWAGEGILKNTDMEELNNTGRYSFFVRMSCLTGYFGYLHRDTGASSSLAEALMESEGSGAAAAFMPTAMTPTSGQRVLNTALFETIFMQDTRYLGEAIAKAKQSLLANGSHSSIQVSETFLLFGDPATQLKVPLPRRPAGFEATFYTEGGVAMNWLPATDCDGQPVAGYNVYRKIGPTGKYEKVNSDLITIEKYFDSQVRPYTETYYYAVSSVDTDGDESVKSQIVSPAYALDSPGGDGGGVVGGGCFIDSMADSKTGCGLWVWAMLVFGLVAGVRFRPSTPGGKLQRVAGAGCGFRGTSYEVRGTGCGVRGAGFGLRVARCEAPLWPTSETRNLTPEH